MTEEAKNAEETSSSKIVTRGPLPPGPEPAPSIIDEKGPKRPPIASNVPIAPSIIVPERPTRKPVPV